MILLVEDNENDIALMLQTLEKHLPGSAIRIARDGTEALELLASWQDKPLQLVLLDLHLPHKSGLQVLGELRTMPAMRHVPVVMLSGAYDSGEVARSYDLGANSFLSKEDRSQQFATSIELAVPYWLHLNRPCTPPGDARP